MAKFEVVSRFANADLPLPVRKTEHSAGYDMVAAETIIIPPYADQNYSIFECAENCYNETEENIIVIKPVTLSEMADFTKKANARPVLVSTGMKCKLDPGTYLELSVRSSSPLKYWLILANGVGIIDADYYNNPDNEGEIFFQLINLSPCPLVIQKGEAIGQGIIKSYLTTEDDAAAGSRIGGFGSTGV